MSQAAATVQQRYDSATARLEPPFAVIDLAAMRANAAAMVRRAAPKPIRLASKSVRCRQLIETVLRMDGFRGILAFTLPEALWLAESGTSDRIWFRHAKAGELCERFNELHLVDGDAVVASVPTYRGEGRAFL